MGSGKREREKAEERIDRETDRDKGKRPNSQRV